MQKSQMKKLLLTAVACMAYTAAQAQSLWTSAEIKFKATTGLNVFAEAEYRTQDGLSGTDRWGLSAGLDYRVLPYLKMNAGYTFIYEHTPWDETRKGNLIPPFWQPKHRGFFSVTGNYNIGRFTFSLRERYQYTYRTEQTVPKYGPDGVTPKNDELISGKGKHVLRSRFEVEYSIRKSGFTPFVSVEIYNLLSEAFNMEKTRFTAGTAYRFNKKNSVSLFYRYIDISGDDDDGRGGHIIGIGYQFKL